MVNFTFEKMRGFRLYVRFARGVLLCGQEILAPKTHKAVEVALAIEFISLQFTMFFYQHTHCVFL